MKRIFSFAIVAAVCFASTLTADVVNVNVTSGNGSNAGVTLDSTAFAAGVAPIAYTGSTWNDIGGGLVGPVALFNSDNVASGITFERTSDGGNSGANFTFSHTSGGAAIFDNYLAANNGFGPAFAGPIEYQLTGLDDSLTYNITFLSSGDTVGQGGSFTIGGTTLETSAATIDGSAFIEGDNMASFTSLTSTSGVITVSFEASSLGTASFAAINGFQIESISAVPEPTSMALIGLGSLFLVVRRRK